MTKLLSLFATVLVLWLGALTCGYAMHCQDQFINEGDLVATLFEKCGTPNYSSNDLLYYKQDGVTYEIRISDYKIQRLTLLPN